MWVLPSVCMNYTGRNWESAIKCQVGRRNLRLRPLIWVLLDQSDLERKQGVERRSIPRRKSAGLLEKTKIDYCNFFLMSRSMCPWVYALYVSMFQDMGYNTWHTVQTTAARCSVCFDPYFCIIIIYISMLVCLTWNQNIIELYNKIWSYYL